MGLAIATKSFECAIDGGLAHIVLNQSDRGNPIDGDFCHEFTTGRKSWRTSRPGSTV
jgi:2-(1,2-epoxy-1,2-dihydrophenyl)acetyl-CoA isomerase